MTDIEQLAAKYEAALEASQAAPGDEKKHRAAVIAGEMLASARKVRREADVKAGIRSPGVGVIAEGGDR